jgi:hypothetical protein
LDPVIDLQRFGVTPNNRPSGRLELELRCLVRTFRAVGYELTTRIRLPWKQRMKAWKAGFSTHAWRLYKLPENDPNLYLPDIRASLGMYKVNGFSNPVIGNKLILSRLLETHRIPHPAVVSMVLDGRILEEDVEPDRDLWRALNRTLDRFPRQVFRPTWAGGGQGVFFLDRDEGGLRLNGRSISRDEACALFSRLDRYLSTKYQTQADYARRIYPGSANTLRVVTLWDAECGGAFILAITHRFGTARTGMTDNFHGGFGGICAAVDAQAGRLGPALGLNENQDRISFSSHPDTGEPIEGVVIPRFRECVETVLKAANHFPFCPWIGWDVLITEDGVSILEANTLPAFTVSQVHTPFLKDPRARRVFERWGLVG